MMKETYTYDEYCRAAEFIRERISVEPEFGLVLGSGYGDLANEINDAVIIETKDIPGWPVSTVEGHAGCLVIGTFEGKTVLVQQGRVHFYEGYSPAQISFPVRVMILLGIRKLIVTNASGAVNLEYHTGDLMMITDHVAMAGFVGHHPLFGPNLDEFGPRFVDMSEPYDRELMRIAREAAKAHEIPLKEGVYAWLSGPSYETAAEARLMRVCGVDATGMSTVPEVITAVHGGMRVLGFSGVTADPVLPNAVTVTEHEEVLAAADQISAKLLTIIRDVIRYA